MVSWVTVAYDETLRFLIISADSPQLPCGYTAHLVHPGVLTWCAGKQKLMYNSGHRNNVFQARALPGSNDATIVSCAADGQVSSGHACHCTANPALDAMCNLYSLQREVLRLLQSSC